MSFRALVVFVFLAVVSAFAPVSRVASRAALKMATEPMVGGSVEVKFLLPNSFEKNDVVYDPLDMLKLHDLNPEVFPHPKWLRESELKHCRIAMLAAIGAYTSQLGLVIPGYEDSLKVRQATTPLLQCVRAWSRLHPPLCSLSPTHPL